MKKKKSIIILLVLFSISLAITPPAIPQVGTYTFHGAPGNQKILRVRTVNNASLEDLWGVGWTGVLESSFGDGCVDIGAGMKSVVVAVNTSDKLDLSFFGLGVVDIATYVTDTWNWTLGAFSNTPHNFNVTVSSFYNPVTLSSYITAFWALAMLDVNVSVQNAAIYFAQLPTSVAQYLGAIVWEDKWENVGNTIVHHAEASDWSFLFGFQYLENCTEVWTFDETYGAFIGYKTLDDESNTIYEFSIDLAIGIPGYELSIIFGVGVVTIIGVIFVTMKKKR